jgi:hypothetical protein
VHVVQRLLRLLERHLADLLLLLLLLPLLLGQAQLLLLLPQRLLQGENDGVGGLVRVPVQVLLLPGDGGNVSAGGIVAGFGSGLVLGPEGQARPTPTPAPTSAVP